MLLQCDYPELKQIKGLYLQGCNTMDEDIYSQNNFSTDFSKKDARNFFEK